MISCATKRQIFAQIGQEFLDFIGGFQSW